MFKVHVYRNTSDRKYGFAKLPATRLFWLGPVFVLVNHA